MGDSKLIIKRGFAFNDMARAYKVYVDGIESGKIMPNQTLELEVGSGTHEVQFKVDWCSSPATRVEVGNGESVEVTCRASNLLPGTGAIALPFILLGFSGTLSKEVTLGAMGVLIFVIVVSLTVMSGSYIRIEARA